MSLSNDIQPDCGHRSPEGAIAPIMAFAELLCRTIAPHDLADVPLYIVRQSEISREFGNAEGCDGYTTPSLDLYVRDCLGNRWCGRGPCMVINDTALLGQVVPGADAQPGCCADWPHRDAA